MTYDEAINGCKLGEFMKLGMPVPELVVHVGANDGYEIPFYLDMGVKQVTAYEPDPRAFVQLKERFDSDSRVSLSDSAISNRNGIAHYLLTEDSHNSGLLFPDSQNQGVVTGAIRVKCQQLPIMTANCSGLVIDVQGAELYVLSGIREIHHFDYIVVEVSAKPEWIGSHYGQSVLDYLDVWGFRQYKPSWWVPTYGDVNIPSHDDLLLYNNNANIDADIRRKLCPSLD